MPPGASDDALRILTARGVRAFGDGFVALLLPIYLVELGFGALAIGAIVTSTLIGTAILTLGVGWIANRYSRRLLLLIAAILMAATGAGFAMITDFLAAARRRLCRHNEPDFGRCERFRAPRTDRAHADHRAAPQNCAVCALQRHRLRRDRAWRVGGGASRLMTTWTGCTRAAAMQLMFGLYAALGLVALAVYRPLSPQVEIAEEAPKAPLQQSKMLVYGMAALFGMDSFGTGFLVQSLLALWLYQAFQVSITTAAAILFWSSLCSAFSYLVAVPIAARIGLINTKVFTHLPSNVLLILIPFAPNLATAIGLLLARSALSQMDVPTRTSYVMAVVTPPERPAAASITAVPKTFAWAAGSMISGYLLTLSSFGWPLVIGGVIKGVYDILLLIKFQKVRPPEEASVLSAQ
jgi:MFS family permease